MFQTLFNVAQELARQKTMTGPVTPGDTVCVICTASNRMYAGISYLDMQNGQMFPMHAELDAIRRMREAGDVEARFLLLITTAGCQPLLPCAGCISLILGLSPTNAACQAVFPDRMIPLTQVGMVNGSMPAANAAPYGQTGAGYGSIGSMPYNSAAPGGTGTVFSSGQNNSSSYPIGQARPKKSGGSRLKGKVGNLINAGKEIGEDEKPENEFLSKLFEK